MSLNDDFRKDPSTFLKTHVVLVSNCAEHGGKNLPSVRDFEFAPIARTAPSTGSGAAIPVALNERKESQNTFKAYWLPWKTKDITIMDLGDQADYFFTSQMTGCRFTVLTNTGATTVKVAHLAGTWNKTDREGAELAFVAQAQKTNPELKKVRRLSASGGKKHGYTHQCSAFTYGVRKGTSWTFRAQIVDRRLVYGVDLSKEPVPNILQEFVYEGD